MNDLVKTDITNLITSAKNVFESRQISNDINFEAESGFAIQALMNNEYALSVARVNRQSVVDAVTNVAAIGISLNPAKKQAYLVPRKGAICLDISYMGLIDLAVATGSILWAQCVIVYETDSFELNGVDKQPTHTRDPFKKDKGPINGAYSCVKTPQGDFLTHAMPISEIYAIRDRSEAYKKSKSGPWATDEGEMIKKTVIKQAFKYWPKTSPHLEQAINYLNNDGVESIDFKSEIPVEPRFTPLRYAMIEQAKESAIDAFEAGNIKEAHDSVYGLEDNDEVLEAWGLLKDFSKVRSAIKKYHQENVINQ